MASLTSYINVDESLLGGKLRELHKDIGCSRNEAIGALVGLWLWGTKNAGADGTLRGCDSDDLIEILAVGLDRRYDPENVLAALIDKGWLDVMPDGSLQIHDWAEWRKHYNKFIADKEKNKKRQREFRERHAGESRDDDVTDNVTVTETGEKKQEKPATGRRKDYGPEFERFWAAYPSNRDKGMAYKKWCARINDGFEPEAMILAAQRYAAECAERHTEERYIKNAKTFLGDSTPFTDYLRQQEEPQRGPDENPFV